MSAAATGRCLCGQLRYRCDEPVEKLVLCACRDCQYITGGEPNAAALVRADGLHVDGETTGYTSAGGSGLSRYMTGSEVTVDGGFTAM